MGWEVTDKTSDLGEGEILDKLMTPISSSESEISLALILMETSLLQVGPEPESVYLATLNL